ARPEVSELLGGRPGEPSADVAARVAEARRLAEHRGVRCNAELTARDLERVAPLRPGAATLLEHALRCGSLSARGLERVRRVARTLADLAGGSAHLEEEHVCMALDLRTEHLLEAVPV